MCHAFSLRFVLFIFLGEVEKDFEVMFRGMLLVDKFVLVLASWIQIHGSESGVMPPHGDLYQRTVSILPTRIQLSTIRGKIKGPSMFAPSLCYLLF